MIQNFSESQKSSSKLNSSTQRIITGFFLSCLILMLWNYQAGYDNSLDWEVTTTAEVIEFPAWELDNGLIKHEIMGEKYLLQENYSGSEIKRNLTTDQTYLVLIWLGVCIFLAASTYISRYPFFVIVALLTLMLNRLNLFELGLFGIESKMVVLIPFIAFVAPLIYFHEYRKEASFLLRLGSLIVISIVISFGIGDPLIFTDHFAAHSLFSFSICSLIFLFIISEEIVYSLLFVVTSGKDGKSNHLHFTILTLIYLGNLVLYYLNKSGIFKNSFFFFDPFILLAVTCVVFLWSLKFKNHLTEKFISTHMFLILVTGLGIVTLGFLSFSMNRGVDAVYQSMHYFILYFHIGFGAFFFLYIIANFLDPLIKGFEVHKIAYRERNFPYVTAKLGGLVCICAFYFYAGQGPYNLLRSGYLNYLSAVEKTLNNDRLSKEYLIQASFLGYNTHYPNYELGWIEQKERNEFRSKTNFFNAAQRFPSPYAWVNYGNMDMEVNPNKVQAIYEEALRNVNSPEMKNNLGILHVAKGNAAEALEYFESMDASDQWNQAPLLNKWNVYKKIEATDSTSVVSDFEKGNYGVKANILTTISEINSLTFSYDGLDSSAVLHRQSYLLNSSYVFTHDSIAPYLRKELDRIADSGSSSSSRLSKALALHLYSKGEVNDAFLILDDLQANSPQYKKGEYLDALGKLAIDQGAYQSAIVFFDKALEVKHEASRLNRIEALAGLNRNDEIRSELLKIVKKDPGLTSIANNLLDQLETYTPKQNEYPTIVLGTLSDSLIIQLARKNAFNEDQVIAAVNVLAEKGASGGYELLINALEINPYSQKLQKKYILAALDWNLVEYAKQSLDKLQSLITAKEFSEFKQVFEARKKALEDETW